MHVHCSCIYFQGIAETMGQAAASTLSATIQNTYREAFHSTVIPAFERSCASMFEQINGSFDTGTKECRFRVPSVILTNRIDRDQHQWLPIAIWHPINIVDLKTQKQIFMRVNCHLVYSPFCPTTTV